MKVFQYILWKNWFCGTFLCCIQMKTYFEYGIEIKLCEVWDEFIVQKKKKNMKKKHDSDFIFALSQFSQKKHCLCKKIQYDSDFIFYVSNGKKKNAKNMSPKQRVKGVLYAVLAQIATAFIFSTRLLSSRVLQGKKWKRFFRRYSDWLLCKKYLPFTFNNLNSYLLH